MHKLSKTKQKKILIIQKLAKNKHYKILKLIQMETETEERKRKYVRQKENK